MKINWYNSGKYCFHWWISEKANHWFNQWKFYWFGFREDMIGSSFWGENGGKLEMKDGTDRSYRKWSKITLTASPMSIVNPKMFLLAALESQGSMAL